MAEAVPGMSLGDLEKLIAAGIITDPNVIANIRNANSVNDVIASGGTPEAGTTVSGGNETMVVNEDGSKTIYKDKKITGKDKNVDLSGKSDEDMTPRGRAAKKYNDAVATRDTLKHMPVADRPPRYDELLAAAEENVKKYSTYQLSPEEWQAERDKKMLDYSDFMTHGKRTQDKAVANNQLAGYAIDRDGTFPHTADAKVIITAGPGSDRTGRYRVMVFSNGKQRNFTVPISDFYYLHEAVKEWAGGEAPLSIEASTAKGAKELREAYMNSNRPESYDEYKARWHEAREQGLTVKELEAQKKEDAFNVDMQEINDLKQAILDENASDNDFIQFYTRSRDMAKSSSSKEKYNRYLDIMLNGSEAEKAAQKKATYNNLVQVKRTIARNDLADTNQNYKNAWNDKADTYKRLMNLKGQIEKTQALVDEFDRLEELNNSGVMSENDRARYNELVRGNAAFASSKLDKLQEVYEELGGDAAVEELEPYASTDIDKYLDRLGVNNSSLVYKRDDGKTIVDLDAKDEAYKAAGVGSKKRGMSRYANEALSKSRFDSGAQKDAYELFKHNLNMVNGDTSDLPEWRQSKVWKGDMPETSSDAGTFLTKSNEHDIESAANTEAYKNKVGSLTNALRKGKDGGTPLSNLTKADVMKLLTLKEYNDLGPTKEIRNANAPGYLRKKLEEMGKA